MSRADKPKLFEEVLALTRDSVKSKIGGILGVVGLLTGCGAREVEDSKNEIIQRLKNNPTGNVIPDVKFNGTDSADSMVESIINEAKENGAWDNRKADRPRVKIVEKIGDGSKLAECAHVPYGIEEGSKAPQGDMLITRRIDNASPEKRKEIIAHEMGHCVWEEQDNDDPSDLMYSSGSNSKKGRDKERLEEILKQFWDRNR